MFQEELETKAPRLLLRISNGQIKTPVEYDSPGSDSETERRVEKHCEICGEIVETDQFQLIGNRYYCSFECLEVDAKDSREDSESGENDVFYVKVLYAVGQSE
jgi:predicted nucleic acid-binding Zn ribbon protein